MCVRIRQNLYAHRTKHTLTHENCIYILYGNVPFSFGQLDLLVQWSAINRGYRQKLTTLYKWNLNASEESDQDLQECWFVYICI